MTRAEDTDARPNGGAPAAPDAVDPSEGSRASRKERVLHTRVPAVLERELKRFADNLRVPVSNLVRTILEDALLVADAATGSVEERLKRAARHLELEREKLKRRIEADPSSGGALPPERQDGLEGIVAFQEVTLAAPTACAGCGRELRRGARAHLAIPEAAGQASRFVCEACLPRA